MELSDVDDWLCYVCESGGSAERRVQSFKQILFVDNPFSLELCALYDNGQVSLSFQLLNIGSMEHRLIADFGRTFDIEKRKQEAMEYNLILLSSLLFWEFELGKDETMGSSCSKILAQAQQKALLLIGPAGAHRFMYLWASRFSAESLVCPKEYPSMLRISYNTNIGGFWRISSYSPLLSMETSKESQIEESRLQQALSYHLLHCIFQFGHDVKLSLEWIEVCLKMDNVRCDVFPLDPMYFDLEFMNIIAEFTNERHFPAKICLTIGPENGCDVHSVSLTLSSHNSLTKNSRKNKIGINGPGIKASTKTSSTETINNWGFEQSVVNYSDAKIDWTLYDSSTGKAVFNNGPPKFSVLGPKTWFTNRYSKASRAFTEEGGVVFAKDNFGNPIIWRLNRDLEGQTLKWIVKGSIWITYWPNAQHTRFSETRRHDFRQELDLTLPKSSASTPD
ncbi:hypothetical protein SUGI_1178790 [Cryptomeria japonica]|nr:hypothetical protein SUGI_1178790 [Cryptomeria japonica]